MRGPLTMSPAPTNLGETKREPPNIKKVKLHVANPFRYIKAKLLQNDPLACSETRGAMRKFARPIHNITEAKPLQNHELLPLPLLGQLWHAFG